MAVHFPDSANSQYTTDIPSIEQRRLVGIILCFPLCCRCDVMLWCHVSSLVMCPIGNWWWYHFRSLQFLLQWCHVVVFCVVTRDLSVGGGIIISLSVAGVMSCCGVLCRQVWTGGGSACPVSSSVNWWWFCMLFALTLQPPSVTYFINKFNTSLVKLSFNFNDLTKYGLTSLMK